MAEGPDIVSVYISGRDLHRIGHAGQFFRWRFLHRDFVWQAHPFSLSASPHPDWLRLTVKVVGAHTSALRALPVGVGVWAQGPYGAFTALRRTRARALLIAGGSGIAPIRALLEELPPGRRGDLPGQPRAGRRAARPSSTGWPRRATPTSTTSSARATTRARGR